MKFSILPAAACLAVLLSFATSLPAALRISEFMASNDATLSDEDGDNPDWIELHNSGPDAIDLDGYYLSDSASFSPTAASTFWRFPPYPIAAGSYLVIFASGKDRRPAAPGELHTSFSLAAGGENLLLVAPDGSTLVDAYFPAYPAQRADVSYGRGRLDDPDLAYIKKGSSSRVFIPDTGAPPPAWAGGSEPFDDSSWLPRLLPVGFDSTTGGFDLIENFAALNPGALSGQNGWSASGAGVVVAPDPAAGENQVMTVDSDNLLAHTPIAIPEGSTATLFFRMHRDGIVNISVGTSASTTPTDFGNFETQVNNQNDSLLKVRDAGAFDNVATFADSAWYRIWMVIDNAANTYEVYAEGGPLASQTLLASGGQSIFTFRNGSAAGALNTFYLRMGPGNTGTFSIDDIYLAPGTNLATPTSGGSSVGQIVNPGGNIGAELAAAGASSAYLRIPFTPPASRPAPENLTLTVRYDDGFVAYLNSTAIARRNAPVSTPPHDATATADRPDLSVPLPESIDVSAFANLIVPGQPNVLALHALNFSAADPEFLIAPELAGVPTTTQTLYFPEPTPGLPNKQGVLGFVADTAFSIDRGHFTAPFDTLLTTSTPGATLVFTTDGSVPTLENGTLVPADDPASPPVATVRITTTTTLRAAAFKEGFLPTNTDTQTYLFPADVVTQPATIPGYPTVLKGDNGSTTNTIPADYEMDPEITGSSVYSHLIEPSLRAIPSISIVTAIPNLFDPNIGIYQNPQQSGPNWERPASIELIHPDGTPGFQAGAGLRIQGGHTRSPSRNPKHSFRVSFRRQYGPPSLNYPLFEEPTATTKFDEIVLRGFGNQSWLHHNNFLGDNRGRAQYIRDQWAKDTQLAMGWPACHNNLAHLYLNGIYWGVYNLTERPTGGFGESYLGGYKDDYDALNSGEIKDGDSTAFNDLFSRANADLSTPANYDALAEVLNLTAFADYILLNQFGGNLDWDDHNWYALRNRNGGQWHFVGWDNEFFFIDLADNILTTGNDVSSYRHPTRIWKQLMRTERFALLFADRIHLHLFNDGLLTPASVKARYLKRRNAVYDVLVTESARWGDYRRDVAPTGPPSPIPLYDRDEEWQAEFDRVFGTGSGDGLLDSRTATVLSQYQSAGFYPTTSAPEFTDAISLAPRHGGSVPVGFQLALTGYKGKAFFTTDGSDPNDDGAIPYSGPITLTETVTIKARAINNGVTSALTETRFLVGQSTAATLVISELAYDPAPATAAEDPGGLFVAGDFEFIELLNVGPFPIDLAGLSATDGVTFTIGTGTGNPVPLDPGTRALIVRNLDAFAARYPSVPPSAIVATFPDQLNDGGESLTLKSAFDDTPIISFTYDDNAPWPNPTGGYSIVLRNPFPGIDHGDPASWRRSASPGGVPNATDATTFATYQAATPGASLLDYLFQAPPSSASPVSASLATGLLALTFPRNPAADDLVLTIESSPDLATWSPAATVIHSATNLPDGTLLETHRLRAPDAPLPHFLRLRATVP